MKEEKLNTRVEKSLKEEIEELSKDMGVDKSSFVRMAIVFFIKHIKNENKKQ